MIASAQMFSLDQREAPLGSLGARYRAHVPLEDDTHTCCAASSYVFDRARKRESLRTCTRFCNALVTCTANALSNLALERELGKISSRLDRALTPRTSDTVSFRSLVNVRSFARTHVCLCWYTRDESVTLARHTVALVDPQRENERKRKVKIALHEV